MHLIDMFELWSLVEEDLLSETIPYRLRDTGQGMSPKGMYTCILTALRSQPSAACTKDVAKDA